MNTKNHTHSPIDTESLPWMPLGEGVFARFLRFAGEERSLQLKVMPGVTIPHHAHSGWVHAYGISGARRLEDGSIAGPGSYVYEPAGNVDCWSCAGDEPCIVQISMSGALSYVDEDGKPVSRTDTAGLRKAYLEWCEAEGHEPVAIGA